MTDVISQVVEMPCPGPTIPDDLAMMWRDPDDMHEQCCQATFLRWPGLSRETLNDSCSNCGPDHPFSRVPDVTLEKVLGILLTGWATMELHWPFDKPWIVGPLSDEPYQGTTLLEAACAALLNLTSPVK